MQEAQTQLIGVARARNGHAPACDRDLAAVGLDDARKNPNQRAPAGAVLAHERVNLAGLDGERGVAERRRAPIGLRETGYGK
jgi:hypothetical protein